MEIHTKKLLGSEIVYTNMVDSHIPEAYEVEAGDKIKLILEKEGERTGIIGLVEEKNSESIKEDPRVEEEFIWKVKSKDGNRYMYGKREGLRHNKNMEEFPHHIEFHKIPEDKSRKSKPEWWNQNGHGYIVDIKHLPDLEAI